MKTINRLMSRLSIQFDNLVGQIENHEAVAEATIRQLREDIRNAKVQFKLIHKDIQKNQQTKEARAKELLVWQERAKKYAETDREKALHCMRRVKQYESEMEHLDHSIQELESVSEKLKSQLMKVEGQYLSLRNRIQSLACREHVSHLHQPPVASGVSLDDMEDIFSRWEKSILKKEVSGEISYEMTDDIEEQMKASEEKQDLEMALDELINKQ